MNESELLQYIRTTLVKHLHVADKNVINLFWEAHESCKRGEWEDTGDLRWSAVNLLGVPDYKIDPLIAEFKRSTLINNDESIDQ